MSMRVCEVCGRRWYQHLGRPAKRCQACRKNGDKYGWKHRQARTAALKKVVWGVTRCTRCPEPLLPGQKLALDHAENGSYLGLAHESCNARAGALKRNALYGPYRGLRGGGNTNTNPRVW